MKRKKHESDGIPPISKHRNNLEIALPLQWEPSRQQYGQYAWEAPFQLNQKQECGNPTHSYCHKFHLLPTQRKQSPSHRHQLEH